MVKPLVLLDVDGVINDLRAKRADTPSFVSHGWPIHVPDYMPKLIQAIHAIAEIRWLTTWRERANDDIAPYLGIPALEVVTDGGDSRYVEWKPAAAIPVIDEALEAERTVYWIEDHEYLYPYPPFSLITMITTVPRYVLEPHMVPKEIGGW